MLTKLLRWNRLTSTGLLLCFCGFLLTGCASFRRKFVRHSKDKVEKEDFVPVLVPVEYKRVEVAPLDAYRDHYSMVKAYFDDVYASLGNHDISGKRDQYLITQIIAHLQGMSAGLNGARKTDADAAVTGLQELLKEFDKAASMRRYDVLKGSVHRIENDIRRKLKPDMVKEFLLTK